MSAPAEGAQRAFGAKTASIRTEIQPSHTPNLIMRNLSCSQVYRLMKSAACHDPTWRRRITRALPAPAPARSAH
jgi:hypothetical protein